MVSPPGSAALTAPLLSSFVAQYARSAAGNESPLMSTTREPSLVSWYSVMVPPVGCPDDGSKVNPLPQNWSTNSGWPTRL